MKLILEYDDFCSQEPENCLDIMYEMIKEVPHIKFNMFTVPAMRGKFNDEEWIKKIKELIEKDNLRICVHGLYHTQQEFENMSIMESIYYLHIINNYMNEIIGEAGWLKVFRGPHWGINKETITNLINLNYTHIYNHEDHRFLEKDFLNKIKFIYYNQNLRDEMTPKEIMIAHGHTHNVCENGIEETKDKVLKFINQHNPEFIWANEV